VELVCDGECALDIRDDGVGFNTTHDAGDIHVGLRIMRERAHRIDAELTLESAPGQGTLVRLAMAHGSDTRT
jgi:two-component system nitrate/nitrite sensor histidine kinase NarX